jgi:hypothetical protein
MAGISAKENVMVLGHLSEGKELRKSEELLDVDSFDMDDIMDDNFD